MNITHKTTTHIIGAIVALGVLLGVSITVRAQEFDYGYDFSDYGGIGDAYNYTATQDYSYYDYQDYYGGAGDAYDYSSYNYDYNYADYGGIGDAYDFTSYNYDYNYDDYSGIGDAYDYSSYNYDYNYDDYAGIGDAYSYDDLYSGDFYDYDYNDYGGIGDAYDYGSDAVVDAGGDTTDDVVYADAGGDVYEDYVYGDAGGDSTELAYAYPYYDYGYDNYYPYNYGGGYYDYVYPTYTYPTYTYPTYTYDYPNYPTHQSPTCTFTARPGSIDEGEEVELVWSTRNATNVSINNGIGTVGRSGSRDVSPATSRTYVLVASGPGGSTWCIATVVVERDIDDNDNVSCDSFTASDTLVDEGDTITLEWRTTNADDVDIDNGVGDVEDDGSERVTIDEDTTFTLTARNGGDTDTCRVTVRVDEDDSDDDDSEDDDSDDDDSDDDEDVSCDAFTASDTRVDEGDRVTLTWRTTNADDVDINNGVGDVEDDGSERVTIDEDTTFTLTARNGGDTDTCRVTVRVDEDDDNDDDDDDNDRSAPRCVFSVSDNVVSVGQPIVLSWNNERTDRLVLRDSSREMLDSDDDRNVNEDRGGITVRPTESTTYTLTVYNGNIRRTCNLDVTVGAATGISLSQVPYTGFEAGPMLTTLFYVALVLWGLFVAYALVLKKNESRKNLNVRP